VTHIPDAETIEPSVLFFVKVAAEELILDSDIVFSFPHFNPFLFHTPRRDPCNTSCRETSPSRCRAD
jgi:hypothetical protein